MPLGQKKSSVHVMHPINTPELCIEPRTLASYSNATGAIKRHEAVIIFGLCPHHTFTYF